MTNINEELEEILWWRDFREGGLGYAKEKAFERLSGWGLSK